MNPLDKINSLIIYFTNLHNIVKTDENMMEIIIDHVTTIISHIKIIDEESKQLPHNIKLNSLIHTEQSDNDSDSEFISSYETDTDDDETINDRIILSEYDNKIIIHNIKNDIKNL
jgi:hypothetical protein